MQRGWQFGDLVGPPGWVRTEADRTAACRRLLRSAYRGPIKRAIDVAVAVVALLLGAPLLLLIAVAIRLDSPGPAVFRQERVGRGGRSFTVLKFRTMRADPSGKLRLFRGADGRLAHKVRHDPRVTRVGRFLRATSLDELPQLVNVLRGEMSLVGPRPELVPIVAGYAPWQHRRHAVRPGLTGWWQVCGRSDRPMHEHTELDLHYVDNVSLGFDLLILVRTVRVVLLGKGAF